MKFIQFKNLSIKRLLYSILVIFAILLIVSFSVSIYKTSYNNIFSERTEKLKYVLEFAMQILENENQNVLSGKKTLEEAQKNSINIIKSVRFGNNDYIWMNLYDGKMIIHPVTSYIGLDTRTFIDSEGYNFGKQIVEIPLKQGGGYLEYHWTKPNMEEKYSFPKVSYVMGYKEWGWILGTGVYIDDINQKVLQSMLTGLLPVLLVFTFVILLSRNLFFNFIIKPIENLSEISLKLSENNLDIDFNSNWPDTEIGRLYKSFNKFLKFFKTNRENENKLAIILDSISDVIVILDNNNKIYNINPAVTKVFGYTQEEALNQPVEMLLQEFKPLVNKKMISDGQKKTGDNLVLEYFMNEIIIDDNGYLSLTIRDITQEKEIEKVKNEFISTISHELRTPLTSIKGSLGLISGGVFGLLPEKVNNLLNIANNNCTRLINLINDILDLEKMKMGKMSFNYFEHNIVDIAKEAVDMNREYAKQFGVEYELNCDIETIKVNVDKDKVIQVLTNLIGNAAKFSKDSNLVRIEIQRVGQNAQVSVTDKGIGIAKEQYSKVFQNFSQIDSSSTRQHGGTGLGLSISKSIIEKMGGSIGFNSTEGVGSTFFFTLPEITEDTSPSRTALIIEDRDTIAQSIKLAFEKNNFNADIASSLKEARCAIESKQYDIITLDIVLPDGKGGDMLPEIRSSQRNSNSPIVIISALDKDNIGFDKNSYKDIFFIDKEYDFQTITSLIMEINQETSKNKIKILHVEDDNDLLNITNNSLRSTSAVFTANDLKEAKKQLSEQDFDLIMLDYKLPDGTAEDILDYIEENITNNPKKIIYSAFDIAYELKNRVDKVLLKSKVSYDELLNIVDNIIA